MKSAQQAIKQVPLDFPRQCGSVSGAQSKLVALKVGGRFVASGMSDADVVARHDACLDLATQLTEHASRKRSQYAHLSLSEFLRRFRAGVVRKGWDLSADELEWVMGRVAAAFGGNPEDARSCISLDASLIGSLSPSSTHAPVETLVDRVRARLQREGP